MIEGEGMRNRVIVTKGIDEERMEWEGEREWIAMERHRDMTPW